MFPILDRRYARGNPQNERATVYPVTLDGTLPAQGNLVFELDANIGVSVSGTDVTGWADQVGSNDLNVVNGTPQLVPGGAPGGNNYVSFDGVDQSIGRATFAGLPVGAANRTLAIYVDYNGPGFGGVSYGTAGSFRRVYGACVSSASHFLFQIWGPDDLSSFVNATSYGWALQICTICGSGLEMAMQVDTTFIVTQTLGLPLNTNPGGSILVAQELDGDPFVALDLAAAWLWDTALNGQEILQLLSFVQQRFS